MDKYLLTAMYIFIAWIIAVWPDNFRDDDSRILSILWLPIGIVLLVVLAIRNSKNILGGLIIVVLFASQNSFAEKIPHGNDAPIFYLVRNMPICRDLDQLKKYYNRIVNDGGVSSMEIARNYRCALSDRVYIAKITEREGNGVKIIFYSQLSQKNIEVWTRIGWLQTEDQYKKERM